MTNVQMDRFVTPRGAELTYAEAYTFRAHRAAAEYFERRYPWLTVTPSGVGINAEAALRDIYRMEDSLGQRDAFRVVINRARDQLSQLMEDLAS